MHGAAAALGRRLTAHGCQRHNGAGGERNAAGGDIAGADHAGKVIQRTHIDLRAALNAQLLRDGRQQVTCYGAVFHEKTCIITKIEK